MYRIVLVVLLALGAQANGAETPVYRSYDAHGRVVFSDRPPAAEHELMTVRTYRVGTVSSVRPKPAKRKTTKRRAKRAAGTSRQRAARPSMAELRRKCDSARHRYQRFRGASNNLDWRAYRARLSKYHERREYWCGRLLRRR